MQIACLVYDGFDELDAIGPYEVFQNAGAAGADCTATIRTVEQRDVVEASHGLRVEPDGPLDEVDPNLVLVPGGGWNDRDSPGAWSEAERGVIPDAVDSLSADGVTVAGVCTGGMLLARAGLTDGRPAVTHAGALDDLRATPATVVEARVVDDGDLLTAGGVTSGLDLAFHLVEREFGSAIAEAVQRQMEYEPRDAVYLS
jgi:transcriptional regulator GlxA family with amidase domain